MASTLSTKLAAINAKMVFNTEGRMTFYKQLAALLKSDRSIDASLSAVLDRKVIRKDPLVHLLKQMKADLNEGKPFSVALSPHIPPEEFMLIQSAERSGSLDVGLMKASKVTQAKQVLRSTMTKELGLPVVLLFGSLGLVYSAKALMGIVVGMVGLPNLNMVTKSAYLTSIFMHSWIWVFAIVGASIIGWVIWSLEHWTGRGRPFFNRFPPYSIYRVFVSSSFMISLATLMEGGTSFPEAVKLVRRGSGIWLKRHLDVVIARQNRGMPNEEVLDTGMMDDAIIDDVVIRAKTANFESAIMELGDSALELAQTRIQSLANKLKLLAMVCVASCLLWVLAGTYLATSDITKHTHTVQQR
jgi:type II secretory pathway component PulF